MSSTYVDLKAHRARVIDSLRRSGILVDPMEVWTADSDEPQKFSAARLSNCNLCILLIGFRRGQVPPGESRSITQIEYDQALRQRIDVLPFLLDDDVDGGAWNAKFDDRRRDPEVNIWRDAVARRHGVQLFGPSADSLAIEPAVTRWVVQTEAKRAARFRRHISALIACICAALLCTIAILAGGYHSPRMRRALLSMFLAFDDPIAFNHSRNGQYELARAIDNLATLRHDTNLSEEIAHTTSTFDMLANNAQYIRLEQAENIMNIVRRGGRVRVILWDYSETNRPGYDAFCRAIKQNPEETREGARNVDAELSRLQDRIRNDRNTYPGSFDVRWNEKPLLYTMWIRDWNSDNALAHLGVHFYQGQDSWPAFRVTRRSGPQLLQNMHAEFEEAWSASLLTPLDRATAK